MLPFGFLTCPLRWPPKTPTIPILICSPAGDLILKQAFTIIAPDAVIHFRACRIAWENNYGDRPFLEELAFWTNHNVTACEENVFICPLTQIIERPGPDYDFLGGFYMSTPEGNITLYEHSGWDILEWLSPRKY